MKRLSWMLVVSLLVGVGFGCETDPKESPDAGNEGVDPGNTTVGSSEPDNNISNNGDNNNTGPTDAAEPQPVLPRPADRTFSIGISDATNGPPQSAALVSLMFEQGDADSATVVAKRVTAPLTLDGDAADWTALPESPVALTTAAASMGLTEAGWQAEYADAGRPAPRFDHGIYEVKVRAAYDDQNLYLLLQWKDTSESRDRDRIRFDSLAGKFTKSGNDDRAYVSFNVQGSFPDFESGGCAAACHIRETKQSTKSLPDGGTMVRGRMNMRTNEVGQKVDSWSWRAFQTNPTGYADDSIWTDERRDFDAPLGWFESNEKKLSDGGIEPKYMSGAGVNASPQTLFLADAGLSGTLAVPYDGTLLQDGATFPGYVHRRADPARADVRAVGKWANDTWTVEFSRKLVNEDPNDEQFPLQ